MRGLRERERSKWVSGPDFLAVVHSYTAVAFIYKPSEPGKQRAGQREKVPFFILIS